MCVCVCVCVHKYVFESSRVEFLSQFCPSVGSYCYSHRCVHVVAVTTKTAQIMKYLSGTFLSIGVAA